jgi:hypothetical protein
MLVFSFENLLGWLMHWASNVSAIDAGTSLRQMQKVFRHIESLQDGGKLLIVVGGQPYIRTFGEGSVLDLSWEYGETLVSMYSFIPDGRLFYLESITVEDGQVTELRDGSLAKALWQRA